MKCKVINTIIITLDSKGFSSALDFADVCMTWHKNLVDRANHESLPITSNHIRVTDKIKIIATIGAETEEDLDLIIAPFSAVAEVAGASFEVL